MDTLTRRILFLTVCIPLRILLVYVAYVLDNKYKLWYTIQRPSLLAGALPYY